MKSKLERFDLAKEVYETFEKEMESFDYVGDDIVYLLGAILTDGKYDLAIHELGQLDDFGPLLRRCFEPSHPVWEYIIT